MSASFLTYDDSSVKTKIANWTQKLPWIKPHYAVKSNPTQQLLLDVLNSKVNYFFYYNKFQVCGFDCAIKNEIKSVLRLGCNPKDVIFSNSVKIVLKHKLQESDIEYAYRKGVRVTTADSIDELIKI